MSWDFVVNKLFQMVGLTVPQNLSSPIQESDTNGREHISLGNMPGDYSLLNYSSITPTTMTDVVHSPVTNWRKTEATDGAANPSVTNSARNTGGSNGSKFSKLQCMDTGSHNILCVKFECCNDFWPCNRCHNNQSTCGKRKLTSHDTKMVKCVYCDKVQQFGQFCCDYGAKFAEYYHCERCENCRVHGDRSFHCDVCGLCLDVKLRGNHKCREGSAHDEFCISLEDAFTGCQILPFSHWVHKDCATQTISSGMVRCPICRESFALILEGRQLPNSRKRTGK